MNTIKITLLLILATTFQINAQEQQYHKEKHINGSGFRIIGIIGHTFVDNEGLDNVFVPSWGLDLEYWFNHKWGLGLHNDVEIETFLIKNSENKEIERVNPLVITIDALYQFGDGFVITFGPGIELERKNSFYLLRIGIEYEKDINQSFYVIPNLFLDQRFDGYNTLNIGLGIGMRL